MSETRCSFSCCVVSECGGVEWVWECGVGVGVRSGCGGAEWVWGCGVGVEGVWGMCSVDVLVCRGEGSHK